MKNLLFSHYFFRVRMTPATFLVRSVRKLHVGSKGWYVEKLKDKGVRHYEGRKIEKFKAHVLANLLEEKNKPTLNRSVHGLFFLCDIAFYNRHSCSKNYLLKYTILSTVIILD